MRNLVLLTTWYPFGKFQESFLETEINYLALKFDTIYIIATKPNSLYKRPVPDNIEVFSFPADTLIKKSLSVIVKHGYSIVKYTFFEIPFIFKQGDKNVLKKLKELLKHLLKAFMLKDFIQDKINTDDHNIVVYSYWFNSAAFAAALLKERNKNLKTISRLHSWDLYTERNALNYTPLQRAKALILDRCFFISEQGKRYFETKYGILSSFSVSKLGTKKQEGLIQKDENKTFNIVSCAFLNKCKRINYVIESLALVNEITIQWTHIGSGELFEELNDLALIKLGQKRNISYKFLGDITNSDVIKFYQNNYIHVLINTSESEGLPVSIMEAMSFGIPVIATNVGGVSEIVNKGCGILLDKNCSFNEIKSSILEIYSNYYVYPYRENAYNNWKNNFNADINYKCFADQISILI